MEVKQIDKMNTAVYIDVLCVVCSSVSSTQTHTVSWGKHWGKSVSSWLWPVTPPHIFTVHRHISGALTSWLVWVTFSFTAARLVGDL